MRCDDSKQSEKGRSCLANAPTTGSGDSRDEKPPARRPRHEESVGARNDYFFARLKFSATWSQLITFHQASMYSGRRFWYFR
jgi:hypothetical protein